MWMSMNIIYDIINYIRFISRLISFSRVTYDIKNLSIWYWGRYLIWFYVTSNWYNFDINFDIIYDVIMTLVKSTSYWYHYWYHLWHLLDMDIWYHIDIMMSIFAARVDSSCPAHQNADRLLFIQISRKNSKHQFLYSISVGV